MTTAGLLAAAAGAAAGGGAIEIAGLALRARARRAPDRQPRLVRAALALMARLGRRIGTPLPPHGLARRLEAAGTPFGLTVADVMAVKGAAALLALLAGGPLASILPGRLPLIALIGLPLGGFLAPDLLLARIARRRARTMERELADLLDLLRVATESGLPLGRALAEVGRRHHGLLAREWRAAAVELGLGVPRELALDSLVRRSPAAGMPALVAALRRAERHGTPLADALAAQASEARAERARRIRDEAARAAPKIQLVIALLLVPSVLLLVAAALTATLLHPR